MKKLLLICMYLTFGLFQLSAEDDKIPIPTDDKWENKNDRDINSPQLWRSESFLYIYSEKQLDNLTIGITDMQGNVYYEEVTTVPAGIYYAISIESLPVGQYYFCIYQGSNYVIGLFTKD